jgi:uncharacterized protein with PQ loop repeat
MTHIIAQSLGYLASLFLAISLLVNNDLKFRWINNFGCISFIIYGVLIHEWPIILTNGILVCINLYYLIKLYQTQENFDLLEFKRNDPLIAKFMEFYKKDINNYFPNFDIKNTDGDLRFIVLRDLVIANIFIANLQDDGSSIVELNYTVPKYRDFKIGNYLFKKEKNFLISKGAKVIIYNRVSNKNHEYFLLKTGFATEMVGAQKRYIKLL